MSDKSEYPECEKLAAVAERSQAIGDFIEWLVSQGLSIRRWVEYSDNGLPKYVWKESTPAWRRKRKPGPADVLKDLAENNPDYVSQPAGWYPDPRSITDFLAEFFQIDLAEVERERRRMLDACRKANNDRTAT